MHLLVSSFLWFAHTSCSIDVCSHHNKSQVPFMLCSLVHLLVPVFDLSCCVLLISLPQVPFLAEHPLSCFPIILMNLGCATSCFSEVSCTISCLYCIMYLCFVETKYCEIPSDEKSILLGPAEHK